MSEIKEPSGIVVSGSCAKELCDGSSAATTSSRSVNSATSTSKNDPPNCPSRYSPNAKKRLIATVSNAPFSEWNKTFTDLRLAAAVADASLEETIAPTGNRVRMRPQTISRSSVRLPIGQCQQCFRLDDLAVRLGVVVGARAGRASRVGKDPVWPVVAVFARF